MYTKPYKLLPRDKEFDKDIKYWKSLEKYAWNPTKGRIEPNQRYWIDGRVYNPYKGHKPCKFLNGYLKLKQWIKDLFRKKTFRVEDEVDKTFIKMKQQSVDYNY